MKYKYYMPHRWHGIGCQPKGFTDWHDFDYPKYFECVGDVWSIIWYDHPLSEEDIQAFELVFGGSEDE